MQILFAILAERFVDDSTNTWSIFILVNLYKVNVSLDRLLVNLEHLSCFHFHLFYLGWRQTDVHLPGEPKKFTRLASFGIKSMQPIFRTKMLIHQSKANLDEKFVFGE